MNDKIKKQLYSGIFYTALAKYSGIIISLIITGVLSRLLSPNDFGVVAIATVIIAFFNLFTDMGLSPAIIQHKSLNESQLADIFSFTTWIGFVLGLLFFLTSTPISEYYDSPILKNICRLLSINLFFASINIVPNALFYKNKLFKHIAVRSLFIQALIGGISILAALTGAGLYALIITPICSSILMFVISFRKFPQKLKLTLGLNTVRQLFSYSMYQFLFNLINYFSRNLDKLLIGKYMTLTDLGYYEKSYRLMMLPLQNITQVITPVMHPVLSDFQDDMKKLAASYERIIRFLALIGFSISILLFFTAKEAVLIIFGTQWIQSVEVFRILTLSVGIQIVLSSSGSIFQAAGDTRSLFICGLFSSILNVTGILIGIFVFGTLTAIAWCIVVTFTINFMQCYWQMYTVTFKRHIRHFITLFRKTGFICIIIIGGMLPVYYLTLDTNIFLSAVIKGLLYVILLSLSVQFTHEYDLFKKIKELKNHFLNK